MTLAIHASGASRNALLKALPVEEWQALSPHLQPVQFMRGQVVYEHGASHPHAYFPTSSIISLLHSGVDGNSTEVATYGNEGVLGLSMLLGGGSDPRRAVVQHAGWGLRVDAALLRDRFLRGGELQRILMRYTQMMLTLTGQLVVCNRRHSIEQQLCRWILLTQDRIGSVDLAMTHEMLGMLLGVRREGVTEAARRLQGAGLVSYRRGCITLVDRAGIEASACECYGVLRRCYDQVTDRDAVPRRQRQVARPGADAHLLLAAM